MALSEEKLRVEHLADWLREIIPVSRMERAGDFFSLVSGGPEGIVLLVTAEHIEIRLPTVEWTKGAYGPRETSAFWKRIKVETLDAMPEPERRDHLLTLFRKAEETRRSMYRKCKFCGAFVPPENRFDRNTCHGCASERLHIVY